MSTETQEIRQLLIETVGNDIAEYFSIKKEEEMSGYVLAWLNDTDDGLIDSPAYTIGQQENEVIREALGTDIEEGIDPSLVEILRTVEHELWQKQRAEWRLKKLQRTAQQPTGDPSTPIYAHFELRPDNAPQPTEHQSEVSQSIDHSDPVVDPDRCLDTAVRNVEAIERSVAGAIADLEQSMDPEGVAPRVIPILDDALVKSDRLVSALSEAVQTSSDSWLHKSRRAVQSVVDKVHGVFGKISHFLKGDVAATHSEESASLSVKSQLLESRLRQLGGFIDPERGSSVMTSAATSERGSLIGDLPPTASGRVSVAPMQMTEQASQQAQEQQRVATPRQSVHDALKAAFGDGSDQPLAPGAGFVARAQDMAEGVVDEVLDSKKSHNRGSPTSSKT